MATIAIINDGLYQATYNFRYDEEETIPSGWVTAQTNTVIKAGDTIHKRVIRIEITAAGGTIAQTFTAGNQTLGTIEVYVKITDATEETAFYLTGAGHLIWLRIINDKWQADVGAGWANIPALDGVYDPADNTWYHLKIHFRCNGAAAYQGLNTDEWQVLIDTDNDSGALSFRATNNYADILSFNAVFAAASFNSYWDAVGYSWDSGYDIGDNLSLIGDDDISTDIVDIKITTEIGKIPKTTARIKDQLFTEDDELRVTDIGTSWQNGRGMYKDSLNFRDDTIGSAPAQTGQGTWTENHGANCDSYIIDKYNKHRNVLQLEDYNGAGSAIIYHDFSDVLNGTIELYITNTDPTNYTIIYIMDGATTALRVAIGVDKFRYNDGSWNDFGPTPVIGQWYHISIDFECESGVYDPRGDGALSADTYKVYIDGTEYGPFNFGSAVPHISRLQLTSGSANSGYLGFFDAIGYSWDSNYTIGDNINLEVTLASQTIFEGQIIKQTREAIQKFSLISKTQELNQPVGTENVPVELITDYSPEMISEMMAQYNHATATEQTEEYRSTYGFENDSNGTIPMGCIDDSEGAGTLEVLTASLDSHKNYVHIDHADADHGALNIFFESQTSGTIEWYVRTSNVASGQTDMVFFDSVGNFKIALLIQGSRHKWYNGVVLTTGSVAAVNIWYHYKLTFDCITDTFSTWVNGDLEADGADFTAVSDNVTSLRFEANHDIGNPTFDSYFDAFGFIWDWEYPLCRTYVTQAYAQAINRQTVVNEMQASGLIMPSVNIMMAGDISGQKVIKDFIDKELMIWYLNPSNEVCIDDGTNDSQIDFSSSDKIWAVKGSDRIQRINKVIVKGGQDGADRFYGSADNLDSQTTYGVKLIVVYAGEVDHATDLGVIAANVLVKHENAPDQVILWRDMSTVGMMQVGETITISASDIEYARNSAFIAAGQWIIRKIIYEPLIQIARIWLIDSLIYEPDEKELESIEKIINAGLL